MFQGFQFVKNMFCESTAIDNPNPNIMFWWSADTIQFQITWCSVLKSSHDTTHRWTRKEVVILVFPRSRSHTNPFLCSPLISRCANRAARKPTTATLAPSLLPLEVLPSARDPPVQTSSAPAWSACELWGHPVAKTLLLYLTTAFFEVYFSLPYIDLADKTWTKEMKRNRSTLTLIQEKVSLGSSLQILWRPAKDALSTRAWQSSWRLKRELSTLPICLRMSPL